MDRETTETNEAITLVYEYLGRIRALERQITRLQLQRDELQSCLLPKAIRYDQDKVQSSPEDTMGETAAAVLDLDRKIEALKREKAQLIREISKTIEMLDDEMEKLVLTAYYICRMPIRKVSDRIHYSRSQTYRLYRSGIMHLSEKMRQMGQTHVI